MAARARDINATADLFGWLAAPTTPPDTPVAACVLVQASPAVAMPTDPIAAFALACEARRGADHDDITASRAARDALETTRRAARAHYAILSTDEINAMPLDDPARWRETERATWLNKIENLIERDLPLADRGAVSAWDPVGTQPDDPAALRAELRELIGMIDADEPVSARHREMAAQFVRTNAPIGSREVATP